MNNLQSLSYLLLKGTSRCLFLLSSRYPGKTGKAGAEQQHRGRLGDGVGSS